MNSPSPLKNQSYIHPRPFSRVLVGSLCSNIYICRNKERTSVPFFLLGFCITLADMEPIVGGPGSEIIILSSKPLVDSKSLDTPVNSDIWLYFTMHIFLRKRVGSPHLRSMFVCSHVMFQIATQSLYIKYLILNTGETRLTQEKVQLTHCKLYKLMYRKLNLIKGDF